jgi:hypothetical protein
MRVAGGSGCVLYCWLCENRVEEVYGGRYVDASALEYLDNVGCGFEYEFCTSCASCHLRPFGDTVFANGCEAVEEGDVRGA